MPFDCAQGDGFTNLEIEINYWVITFLTARGAKFYAKFARKIKDKLITGLLAYFFYRKGRKVLRKFR